MKLTVVAANILWFLYSALKVRRWKRSSKNVAAAQKTILRRLLVKNKDTKFGVKYSFGAIESVSDFQQIVPIQSYEDVLPFIEQEALGHLCVLTADPVQRFGTSSGSTKALKLVPYTASLISDFQEGINPWLYYIMSRNPAIMKGKAYWSITPVGQKEKTSAGGIPIGFDDEHSYFGTLTKWILGNVMATPPELALIQDMDAFRYVTLLFLLQEKSLSWISVWNPTFAILILRSLDQWFDLLVEDIRTGSISIDLDIPLEAKKSLNKALYKSPRRAEELIRIWSKKSEHVFQEVWPNLQLNRCWAHGSARGAALRLGVCFPNVTIQPKGLIATEAFVSFPYRGEASALSLNSHFFEFEEMGSGDIKLAHELRRGGRYSVIVTTSGGLYRYRLNDMIEVLDFVLECPLIRFVGKQDKVVDICGEKLNEQFVNDVVGCALKVFPKEPLFWMMAPQQMGEASAEYVLFVQFSSEPDVGDPVFRRVIQEVDHVLRTSFHYDYCRQLGQLGHCRLFIVSSDCDASEIYLETCVALGQRLGDIKATSLHAHPHWPKRFKGEFV